MADPAPYPEFCPNPQCPYYDRATAQAAGPWYKPHGRFYTQCRGWIRRFRCRACGKTCSTQTFSLHYWTHHTEDFVFLQQALGSGSGLRSIGRYWKGTYRVVQNRVRRLARNSLTLLDAALAEARVAENLVLDGFESYVRGQDFPADFNILGGADSQFFYGVTYSALRRRGRMTEEQKHRQKLLSFYWQPPKDSVCSAVRTLLQDSVPLIQRYAAVQPLYLYSDMHPAYPPALHSIPELQRLLESDLLKHHPFSSHLPRTRSNPLFTANYLDRQIRKNRAEHVRETVQQGREVNCAMERMAIFAATHNFFTPHRVSDHADPSEDPTHAEVAGLKEQPHLKWVLSRFHTHRHLWGHLKQPKEWMRLIWKHGYVNPPALGKDWRPSPCVMALPPGPLCGHLSA